MDMRNFFQKIKLNATLSAVVCILLGVVLVIWPRVVGRVFCYVVGAALLICGVVYVVSYFRRRETPSLFQADLLLGLVLCVLGVWIILRPDMVISLIPVLFGVLLLIHGIVNIQQSLNLKRLGYGRWQAGLAVAIVTLLFGAALLFRPLMAADAAIILLGVGLIFDGGSDLWLMSRLSKFDGR